VMTKNAIGPAIATTELIGICVKLNCKSTSACFYASIISIIAAKQRLYLRFSLIQQSLIMRQIATNVCQTHGYNFKNPCLKASGKRKVFSPNLKDTRICFCALSITLTVPAPNVLCITAVPISTPERSISSSFGF